MGQSEFAECPILGFTKDRLKIKGVLNGFSFKTFSPTADFFGAADFGGLVCF
jgi:hypothetical protein